MSDITQILDRIDRGDRAVAEQLLPLVYDGLRKLAAPTGSPCVPACLPEVY